jgi:hypothetical protein
LRLDCRCTFAHDWTRTNIDGATRKKQHGMTDRAEGRTETGRRATASHAAATSRHVVGSKLHARPTDMRPRKTETDAARSNRKELASPGESRPAAAAATPGLSM